MKRTREMLLIRILLMIFMRDDYTLKYVLTNKRVMAENVPRKIFGDSLVFMEVT